MKTKFQCKLLGALLALVMVLSVAPFGILTVFAEEATEITEIKSVMAADRVPKAGMEVDLFIPNVPDGEHYSRPWNGANWYDSKGVKIAPTVNHHYDLGYEFEAGHTYYADYQYTASDGYVFAENPIITLTGPDPSMFTYEIIDRWDNNESVTVRYTFTIPGEFENADINKVSMMYYGLPKDGGKKPDRCNVIYNNCTITYEEWNTGTWGSDANWGVYAEDGSNAPTFLAGNTYVHMIKLTAKDGYKFSAGLHVQKGTQDAEEYGVVTLSDDRTVATVKFTYEIPSVEIINTIELVAANQHMNFCLRSGESIYLPQPFVPKYVFSADCPYEVENVNSCDWINDETGKYLELGYPQTFENAKKYTLRFHVRIKDEFETTHKFASGTDLGLNVTDYAYANSNFVDFKVSGGGTTATVEVTFTVQFPEGAGSSAGNPAFCYSYEEFKYAMEDPNIRYVALGNADDMLPLVSMSDASPYDDNRCPGIWVRGTKDLILMGNAQFTVPNATENVHRVYENLLLVRSGSRLNISGTGSLTFHGGAVGWPTSVIQVTTDGVLFVNGGTITGDTGNRTAFCYGINVNGGKLYVNGGTVVGTNRHNQAPISAILMYDGVANIYGGTFYSNVSDGAAGSKHYGLMIEENATCYLYGGGFKGISMPYASVMSDYIEDGCTMTVNGVKTDPASCGTTRGFVEVYQEISSVNIHVNSPVAGESPTIYDSEVYLVPEGATVESITWYENGQPWNTTTGGARFTAGNTYTVEIVLTADDGVKFATPLTSATVNYKNATVSAFAGNPETGVVLTVDLGECPNVVPQVDLTVTAPKEGNKPSYSISCGSDAYYAVGGSSNYTEYRQWYMSSDNDDWWEINGSHQFMAGYYYKLVVDIRTNEGYEFPLYDNGSSIMPDVNAYINGYAANVYKGYEQDPSRYITVEYNFGECNDSVVENIIIENVTAPVAGEKPNYNWSIRGSGYQMDTGRNNETYAVKNGMQWLDVTGGNVNYVFENDTFIPGHEYQCTVYVVTENGFEFVIDLYTNPETWPTATVNGYTAEINRDWTDANEARVYYTFTCGAKTVDKVAITDLENPVGGNTPDTAVTVGDADSYTVERVEWFDIEDNPVGATFEAGVPYYALITVTPATGAVFADAETIEVTVNGSELDSVEIENGKLLIYVIIRKPASAPEMSIYAFITQPSGGTVNAGESLNVAWQTSFIPTSTEIQYWDGEAWDQWDIQYPQNALDDYDFESHEAASYRFRIVTYIGNDAVATSNEFVINWAEAVVNEYIYVYTPGDGQGSNDFDYVADGTQITLYTPEYMGYSPIDGFTFDYWSIRKGTAQSAEVAQKQPGEQISIEDNTYIVAIWKEAPLTEYIYVYGPGDGQGSNDFDYVTNGTEITLSTPESMGFTSTEGFTFDYWSIRTGDTAMNPEIAQKQPGDTIIINDDTYIIAIWKALPHECVGLLESGQGATCTVDGWKDYYRCECGKYYEDANCETPISDLEAWKLGDGKTTKDHEPNADDGDCTTDITCSVCGEVTTEGADAHTGGTATCEKKAACTVCGKEYGELADHRFVEGKCECGEIDPDYTPDTEEPDTDVPDTDAIDTDVPGTDTPDTDASGTDMPDTDVPGTNKPEDPKANGCKSGIVGVSAGFITLAIIAFAGILLKKKKLL